MDSSAETIGTVERRIAQAIAVEANQKNENIGFTMMRYGYGLKQLAMRKLIAEFRQAIINPPPSPSRQRAMNAQLARNEK